MKVIFTLLACIVFFCVAKSQTDTLISKIKSDTTASGWTINKTTNQAQLTINSNSVHAQPCLFVDGNTGNVGMGTTIPTNKLEVNGAIRCREISVEASPWPDFVFSESYPLKSIYEVESYIVANHHLPDVPSATEVEKNGVNLSDLNAKLLQKIEELTLYLIKQEKRIDDLENKLNEK